MNNLELIRQNILSKWPESIELLGATHGQNVVLLKNNNLILEVASLFKERGYKVLQLISAIDYPENNIIEVCYFLASFSAQTMANDDIQIKAQVSRENPKIQSVVSLWPSANFLERECFDMMGVIFEGHPDLTRILTSDDWEGYPLRKDYVPAEMWRGIRINPAAKQNLEDRDFSKLQKQDPQAQRPRW